VLQILFPFRPHLIFASCIRDFSHLLGRRSDLPYCDHSLRTRETLIRSTGHSMVFKGALRSVKNVTNGYSDVEAKVRAVTSNDSVIPSGAQMHELAQLSYNQSVRSLRGPPSSVLPTITVGISLTSSRCWTNV
jgi:hypothetical protein